MTYSTILTQKNDHILTISLNRPETRNAFNDTLIAELSEAFNTDALSPDIRSILIRGEGQVFSAGGDLKWLKESAQYSREKNIEDAKKFSSLLETINTFSKPVIGQVHGAALGGGMGLVSVCDYVSATKDSLFGFTEARLGLIPAVIGPFVINKIGENYARAFFLSAERFSAQRAYEIGFIHQVVESQQVLEQSTKTLLANILELSPHALKTAKQFIHEIQKMNVDKRHDYAATTLAELRVSKEGVEGMSAFLEKRKPNW